MRLSISMRPPSSNHNLSSHNSGCGCFYISGALLLGSLYEAPQYFASILGAPNFRKLSYAPKSKVSE